MIEPERWAIIVERLRGTSERPRVRLSRITCPELERWSLDVADACDAGVVEEDVYAAMLASVSEASSLVSCSLVTSTRCATPFRSAATTVAPCSAKQKRAGLADSRPGSVTMQTFPGESALAQVSHNARERVSRGWAPASR